MNNLIKLLETHGPLTGKEIHEKTAADIFEPCEKCSCTVLSLANL